MKIIKKLTVLIFLILAGIISADAQCKNFVKKSCMPKLSPFIPSGQMNTTTMLPGDHAELALTFYSGQSYRILVCYQEILGQVQFKLRDANNNILFNSKDQDNADFWDFNVESTQQLTVEVNVPAVTTENEIVPSGCVSIIVAFKK